MHQPIKDGLEDYLAGKPSLPDKFTSHLNSCSDCAAEVGALQEQARLLGTLRASVEPQAGFYARVMDRIEQRIKPSIWSVMLEPSFGRRIAVICATVTVVLGAYLISTEPGDQVRPAATVIETQNVSGTASSMSAQQDRDAVLVTLASFRNN